MMDDIMGKLRRKKTKGTILGGVAKLDESSISQPDFKARKEVIVHFENLKNEVSQAKSVIQYQYNSPLKKSVSPLKPLKIGYSCPLCSFTGEWALVNSHLSTCAISHTEKSIEHSIKTLYTINDFIILENGIPIMRRYFNNLLCDPTNEKYRKIRCNNKMFENVKNMKEYEAVLKSVGFELYPIVVDNIAEDFYAISGVDIQKINQAIDMLDSRDRFVPNFRRTSRKYLVISTSEERSDPSDREFDMTASDLQNELKRQKEAEIERRVLKLSINPDRKKTKFIILKIRFPDQTALEGYFHTGETASSVFKFVLRHLFHPYEQFLLMSHFDMKYPDSPARTKFLFCTEHSLASLDISSNILLQFRLIGEQLSNNFLNENFVD